MDAARVDLTVTVIYDGIKNKKSCLNLNYFIVLFKQETLSISSLFKSSNVNATHDCKLFIVDFGCGINVFLWTVAVL